MLCFRSLISMRKVFAFACVLVLIGFVAGCSSPVVDATNQESFKASTEKMVKSMSQEEAKEFAGAIVVIGMKQAFSGADPDTMFQVLDGMTADEVVQTAKAMVQNGQARE